MTFRIALRWIAVVSTAAWLALAGLPWLLDVLAASGVGAPSAALWLPTAAALAALVLLPRTAWGRRFVFDSTPIGFLVGVIYGFGALTLVTHFVLSGLQACTDVERAALFQARALLGGGHALPGHPLASFFQAPLTIHTERWFGLLAPGWPSVLSLGVWLRAPFLVTPLVGALSVPFVYRIGVRVGPHDTRDTSGRLAALFFATSPLVVAWHASLGPEPLLVLVGAAATDALLASRLRLDAPRAAALGLTLGVGVLVAPLPGALLAGLAIALVAWRARRTPARALGLLLVLAAASSPLLLALAGWSQASSGSWWPDTAALGAPSAAWEPLSALGQWWRGGEGPIAAGRALARELTWLGPLALFLPLGFRASPVQTVTVVGALLALLYVSMGVQGGEAPMFRAATMAMGLPLLAGLSGAGFTWGWQAIEARGLLDDRPAARFALLTLVLTLGLGALPTLCAAWQSRRDPQRDAQAVQELARHLRARPDGGDSLVFVRAFGQTTPHPVSSGRFVIGAGSAGGGPMVALDHGEMNTELAALHPERALYRYTYGRARDHDGRWRVAGRLEPLTLASSDEVVVELEAMASPGHGAVGSARAIPVPGGLAAELRLEPERPAWAVPLYVRRSGRYRLQIYLVGDAFPTWLRLDLNEREIDLLMERYEGGTVGRGRVPLQLSSGRHTLRVRAVPSAFDREQVLRVLRLDKLILTPES
jgi:hypothetical protein